MDRSSKPLIDTNQSIPGKDVPDVLPGRRRFDDILDYIKDKYGLPDNTWTDKQYRILDADVSRRFSILPYFEQGRIELALRCKSPCTINEENKYQIVFATPDIWDWVMAKYGKANLNWDEEKASMVADDIWRTFYGKTESKQEVIQISLDTEELYSTSSEDIESTSMPGIEYSNEEEDDSDDEELSNSSGELVKCIDESVNKSVIDEDKDEDDTDKEETDDDDDSDDELWTPKTVAKGATSSSSPSTKKKIVKQGEPVRHCIIGLPNPKSKKEFGFKKQVNDDIKVQDQRGKRKME